MPVHVLILDADPERRQALVALLRSAGHVAVPEGSAATAAEGLLVEPGGAAPGFDVLALDLRHPELDLAALRDALAPRSELPPDPLDAAERRHILAVLAHTGGNRRKAALLLGISRSTLLNKLRRYNQEE
jgi:DNA-binding NtrC family response regulator